MPWICLFNEIAHWHPAIALIIPKICMHLCSLLQNSHEYFWIIKLVWTHAGGIWFWYVYVSCVRNQKIKKKNFLEVLALWAPRKYASKAIYKISEHYMEYLSRNDTSNIGCKITRDCDIGKLMWKYVGNILFLAQVKMQIVVGISCLIHEPTPCLDIFFDIFWPFISKSLQQFENFYFGFWVSTTWESE